MIGFLGLVLVAFVCFALVFWIKQRQYDHPALRLPYRIKTPFFQPSEISLLSTLEDAASNDFRVLAKVRLADVFEVTAIPRRAPWYRAVNRISAARLDFVLCDRDTLAPRCAIEMEPADDDNRFLDELCAATGLPLLRLTPETARSQFELREAIDKAIAGPV